ncbi:MAG: LysE family transporter [Bacillota bacterium]
MFNLVPFLSYVFIATYTPGPNNIMSMLNATRYGFTKNISFLLGIFSGFFIIMLLCSYFNIMLYQALPKVKPIMEILGAAYMLYLAFLVLRSNKKKKDGADSGLYTFKAGIAMQFINPKVILYGITVISSFIIPIYKEPFSLIAFSVFLAFIGLTATTCWALFGAVFQSFLHKYKKPFDIAMALLLIYCAAASLKII